LAVAVGRLIYVFKSRASHLQMELRARLPYLDLDDLALRAFCLDVARESERDVFVPIDRSRALCFGVAAICNLLDANSIAWREEVYDTLAQRLLLSTDLFQLHATIKTGELSYQGLFDPYNAACHNPFATFKDHA